MALKCWVVSSEKDWAISDSCEQNRNNRIHKMLRQGLFTGTILVAFPVKTELILTQFIRKKKMEKSMGSFESHLFNPWQFSG